MKKWKNLTEAKFKQAQPGDMLRSRTDSRVFVVTGNYGGRITAVASVDVTNPIEWEIYDEPELEFGMNVAVHVDQQ